MPQESLTVHLMIFEWNSSLSWVSTLHGAVLHEAEQKGCWQNLLGSASYIWEPTETQAHILVLGLPSGNKKSAVGMWSPECADHRSEGQNWRNRQISCLHSEFCSQRKGDSWQPSQKEQGLSFPLSPDSMGLRRARDVCHSQMLVKCSRQWISGQWLGFCSMPGPMLSVLMLWRTIRSLRLSSPCKWHVRADTDMGLRDEWFRWEACSVGCRWWSTEEFPAVPRKAKCLECVQWSQRLKLTVILKWQVWWVLPSSGLGSSILIATALIHQLFFFSWTSGRAHSWLPCFQPSTSDITSSYSKM